ncbi:MAG: ABC transporter permease subunit [Blautia massiliensis (ex Durand et al. 2017)]
MRSSSHWPGLQSVSSDYLEAGKLDGASEWQLFRHITLPLIILYRKCKHPVQPDLWPQNVRPDLCY